MTRRYAYPADLARYVAEHWPAEGGAVDWEQLGEALSVAFQASLTAEEARPTSFRLLLAAPEHLPESGSPNEGVLRLRFDRDRPLSVEELRRLSPSTPFETSLIGGHVVGGKLRIWGIAHSGPAWLGSTWGGRSVVPNWTYDPIIHVTAPGHVAVRCAGKLVGGLERGVLVDALLDVFDSEWLPALFAEERELIREEHAEHQSQTPSPTAAEGSLVGQVTQHMLRRAIQLVRGAHHGGMLLVVDGAGEAARGTYDSLRLKYQFGADEPPGRYRTLVLELLDRLATRTTKPSVGWWDFALDESPDLEKLEQSIFEFSRVLASLTSIDGAVVLDKRFRILGFGAEVSADLPAPERVFRALDVEGHERTPEAVENVGTRHRAAYRFVQHHPQGLAIVISHDGGVSFVANRDQEIVFWEQSVSP